MEQEKTTQEETMQEKVADIKKVYIKNYGNLTLEIIGSNDIGLLAKSLKDNEEMFIPWTSIIMVSDKIHEKFKA